MEEEISAEEERQIIGNSFEASNHLFGSHGLSLNDNHSSVLSPLEISLLLTALTLISI